MYRMYSKHVSVCCCQSSGVAGRLREGRWDGSGISREHPGLTRAGPVRALARSSPSEAKAPESQCSHRHGGVDFPCIMTALLLIRTFSLCCPGLATTSRSSWIED